MRRLTLIRELNSLKKESVEDFEDNRRLARRRKRKCLVERNFELTAHGNAMKKRRQGSAEEEKLMWDRDYEKFLKDFVEHGGEGQDFLDISSVYDGKDHSDANLMDDDVDVEVNTRCVDYGDDNANVRSLDDSLDVDDDDDTVNVNGRAGDDGDDNVDDVDPQYKIFLENFREDGKSYVLELAGENGILELIKYEEDVLLDEPNSDTPQTLKKSQSKERTEIKKTLKRGGMNMNREQLSCLNNSAPLLHKEETIVRRVMGKRNRETLESSEDLPKKKSSAIKKNAEVEVLDPVSGRTKEHSNKRPLSSMEVLAIRGHNHGGEYGDKDYLWFLDHLEIVDGKMRYTDISGMVWIEEDVDSLPDIEILTDPRDRYRTSYTAVDIESGRCIEIRDTSHTKFREGLMKVLKRPYDQKEYDKLFEEVSRRRPLRYDKNLRNGIKSYSVEGKFGPSYRENYRDLAKKIDAARGNDPKILNLLRGFFYWLKNVAKEGSFIPWNDSSCLKVLPSQLDEKRKFRRNC